MLCRERLTRIIAILARYPRGLSVRDFARTFSVWRLEIEQAAELGFVKIEARKPRTGRPAIIVSRVSEDVSETQAAKLPPFRDEIPKPIRHRLWLLALHATQIEFNPRARFGFDLVPRYKAWMRASPAARSIAGARASASRVRRSRDAIAAKQWTFARTGGELPDNEPQPVSATEVWLRLKELGSWRATDGWKPPLWEIETVRRARECFTASKASI
ncbi:MAG: hypothetical protein JNM99_16750 [Verrucomicrobiaceae bacterium]|nr:hypothetical protein [Verrucomicrobiaceae bacterium]